MIVKEDKPIQELWHPIPPKEKVFDGTWLQDLLIAHPDLLPIHEISSDFGALIAMGREMPVSCGSIDNL